MVTLPDYLPYPTFGFPQPISVGFSAAVDTGVSRGSELGFPSQERYSGSNPTTATLEFNMSLGAFNIWSEWIHANAITKWVEMRLPYSPNENPGPGFTPPLTNQIVRFGQYTMTPMAADYFRVVSTVQIMPNGVGIGLAGFPGGVSLPGSGDWVIAGNPGSPSTDWAIAGDPGNPSLDYILAGVPADH